jgi:hypothetical protein
LAAVLVALVNQGKMLGAAVAVAVVCWYECTTHKQTLERLKLMVVLEGQQEVRAPLELTVLMVP